MAHWLICTSSFKTLAAIGVAGLVASSDASTRVADIRPQMTVMADIQGSDFTALLPATGRETLLRFMRDSLRTLLERNFGFLNWRGGVGEPTDTLTVSWVQQGAGGLQDAMLQLRLRGPSVGAESLARPLAFEKWARLQTRIWEPALVSREWSATIDTIFKRQRAELVPQLFGRMPLNLKPLDASLSFLPRDLKAIVRLRPDQIKAADSAKPEFLIRLTVKDTVPPRSVDVGSLELRRCLPSLDEPAYVCRMMQFIYQEDSTTAELRQDLLRRAVLVPLSLHLLRYQPAGIATGPGGTVAP